MSRMPSEPPPRARRHSDEATDCSEVLYRVYEYLDGEMGRDETRRIAAHLQECGPCLEQYDLDQAVKAVVKRSCQCEEAPMELRAQIMTRITQIRIEYTD
ncbi:MAG TPA: mycothiol system anti-sigma-R factor [Dermatophilaceae bacterium]|jgi:anti-sigma factor (TIGR02949 family)|nr:mycothiol system anti-sigma-R factor [Dermatophilaceae bacterium]